MQILGMIFGFWLKGAGLVLVMLFITELIAIHTNHNYMSSLNLQKYGDGKSKTKFITMVMWWLVIWPLIAVELVVGVVKNQTVLERMVSRAATADKINKKFHDELESTTQLLKEAKCHWATEQREDMKIMFLKRYMPNQLMTTHIVLVPHDDNYAIKCMRAMPDLDESLEWVNCNTLDEALGQCIDDYDWSLLCVDGMESIQRQVWEKLKKDGEC